MSEFTYLEWISIYPMSVMALGALVILTLGLLFEKFPSLIASLITCSFATIVSFYHFSEKASAFGGMLYVDSFSGIFNIIILLGTIGVFLLMHGQLESQKVKPSVDINVLILLASIGAMSMVSSSHLIVLFVGFELLSVSVYVLTGLAREEKSSSEGALKYFILGAFSSAFLLYGIALIYGSTGSMNLNDIALMSSTMNPMLILGLGLVIFGFGFKVSLAPFHFWTPDVYQGAPISMTTYMAIVVKAAAFGAFLRLMMVAFISMSQVWVGLIWIMAVLSMCVGNLLALRQKSLKRMLAYSSIAHAGYAAMGLVALVGEGSRTDGASAIIFYILVYSLMTLASFGIAQLISVGTEAQYDRDSMKSLKGLGWKSPLLGLAMTVAMLSLAGMPPMAGFVGKIHLFSAVIQQGFVGLAVIAALNSVVSLYYYLRVIVWMYFEEADEAVQLPGLCNRAPMFAVMFATIATLALGIFSSSFYQDAVQAAKSLV